MKQLGYFSVNGKYDAGDFQEVFEAIGTMADHLKQLGCNVEMEISVRVAGEGSGEDASHLVVSENLLQRLENLTANGKGN